jgi:hypothetical protein
MTEFFDALSDAHVAMIAAQPMDCPCVRPIGLSPSMAGPFGIEQR